MSKYIVERISDGAFLELELPILPSAAGPALSGPGTFSGTIVPVAAAYATAGTTKLIDPYATLIHEEADGIIRQSWLVTRSMFDGDAWTIEGKGFSSYLAGVPYDGEYRGVRVDMADVVRELWRSAQRHARSNLDVTVRGMTGVIRGTDSDAKADAAKKTYDAAKASLKVASDKRKAKSAEIKKRALPFDKQLKVLLEQRKPLQKAYQARIDARKPALAAYRAKTKERTTASEYYSLLVKQKAPKAQIAAAKAVVDALKPGVDAAKAAVDAHKAPIAAAKAPLDAKNTQIKTKRAERAAAVAGLQAQYDVLRDAEEPLKAPVDAAKSAYDAAKEKASEDGGAWKILWWDLPDSMSEMQQAIDEAGWEWVEWSGWNADRSKILKEIRLYPQVGAVRDELLFIEGDNVIEAVPVIIDSADYANKIIAIGAGEGQKALRVQVGVDDGRRTKPHVLDAKHVTKVSVLQKLAEKELARRSVPMRIDGIRVNTAHPYAPLGSFGVGDTITVECDVVGVGRSRFRTRIREIEWLENDMADLTLEA